MSKYNGTPTLEAMFRDLESRVRTLETAPRLPASSIGSGGLAVKDGGNIVVEAGGNINVLGGGAIASYTYEGAGYTIMQNGILYFRLNETENPGRLYAGTTPDNRTALWMHPPNETGEDTTHLLLEGPSLSNEGGVWLRSNGQLTLESNGGSMFLTSQTDIVLETGSGSHCFLGHTTTSNAGNTYIGTNGSIQRSTSSLRYKRDIEDAVINVEDVLKLQPKTWRDKLQVENDPDTKQRYIGFIAEDLHEAGLGAFVVYEDDEPDAIAYDRLAAALIVVIKSQEERLTALEERVNG